MTPNLNFNPYPLPAIPRVSMQRGPNQVFGLGTVGTVDANGQTTWKPRSGVRSAGFVAGGDMPQAQEPEDAIDETINKWRRGQRQHSQLYGMMNFNPYQR